MWLPRAQISSQLRSGFSHSVSSLHSSSGVGNAGEKIQKSTSGWDVLLDPEVRTNLQRVRLLRCCDRKLAVAPKAEVNPVPLLSVHLAPENYLFHAHNKNLQVA